MDILVATQTGGILGPFAKLLGWIFEGLYVLLSNIGIENVGICVILFVIIVKLILLPMTFKQQKFSRMNTIMQPELQAISKKYEGKKDQESLMARNAETQEVYNKYGVSPSGGCLNMLIQLPIMFALYRVIMNIPAYVPQIKTYYTSIIESIGVDNLIKSDVIKSLPKNMSISFDGIKSQPEKINKLVDVLNRFDTTNWNKLKEAFVGSSDVITTNIRNIDRVNSFLGMNLTQSPKTLIHSGVYIAIAIPVLAGLSQFISSKISMKGTMNDDADDNPMAASMKSMTYTMPLLSVFMCYGFATCIGLYWILSSLISMFVQIGIDKYFASIPNEVLIEKSRAKAQAKRARLGVDDTSIKKASSINTKNLSSYSDYKSNLDERVKASAKEYEEYAKNKSTDYKAGGIAEKANLIDKYKK